MSVVDLKLGELRSNQMLASRLATAVSAGNVTTISVQRGWKHVMKTVSVNY